MNYLLTARSTLISVSCALLLSSAHIHAQTVAANAAAPTASSESKEREQLALAALGALLSAPPERAFPLLKRTLEGNQTLAVKKRALFILGQTNTPEAPRLMMTIARTPGPLQTEAIRGLGISGKAEAIAGLAEIAKTADSKTQEAVLNALLIAGAKKEVLAIALASSGETQQRAVRILGAMNATEELRELGKRGLSGKGFVEAYAIAGDLESLNRLASAPGPARMKAIRSMGLIKTPAARANLLSIYRSNPDKEIREAVLSGLLIAGAETEVMSLYRESKDPQEKTRLLRWLGTVGGDSALEAIDAALQGNSP